MLDRRLYEDGRQFQNTNNLKNCIAHKWEKIGQSEMEMLFKSLQIRMVTVVKNKGSYTKY